ncbi:TB2/DP1, HVA22 family-domain-containing protein [Parasitella parasitica]|nr:TB2/DP1, HVA22 family-domain-containing protein [Parasitella parasitica]
MSFKHDKTSKVIEKCTAAIDASAPINISFITRPITSALVDHIKSLEEVYSRSRLYQFLVRKGVYPTFLFSAVSGGVGYGVYRTYYRKTKLTLNLLGVVYPAYCCWQLVKSQLNGQDEKLKSWLTYWIIFGSFQVLDHWMASDLFMFSRKKYNFYKLLILYWAQSPHSKGALLLYRHVIQKPDSKASDRGEEEEEKKERLVLFGKNQHVEMYHILDGYSPPNLIAPTSSMAENQNDGGNSVSSNSSDDDSLGLKYHQLENHRSTTSLSNKKEVYPSLLMNASEAAW